MIKLPVFKEKKHVILSVSAENNVPLNESKSCMIFLRYAAPLL